MGIDAKLVKTLRDKTGAGMMDCKKALVETDGDIEKAVDHLRKTGVSKAEKKGARATKEGLVYSYIHAGGRLGVLVELNCETDFVANTDGFTELAHNIAMQIAATNPLGLDRDSIDDATIAREKDIFTEQAKSQGKPDNIIEKMVEGRINKFYSESCLIDQIYIKDPDKKVGDLITGAISTLGENISINRFIRFAIGEADPTSNGQA
ncbi:MAG: translation elongation factor Ts [Candidatus Marinimicrobia bacterium]|jgi:elongation factor Ts|nr:translation elongation factor Ts [Candidatus Neomarinimicrobiota bacterium]MBT3502443.1 translation elongation factor Ts [Candidatus Neomarinimicrobiota bacterium]MBT3838759.1 translation elongation factor Ts [Candidatus Neomarinimicrobiota bacterium]MBT3999667.1 translation elongation factor Ts [Candidatus Neomarinimicrobiota bacterium]MBT4578768.1 translation elongation factor Ts [Candidatus Neomarinimicrobiota bacterium]